MIRKFLIAAVVMSSGLAVADGGKCVLQVTRTACTGKEKESFSKCNGKASCEMPADDAKDEKACATAAEKACENTPDRQSITKLKVITALFGGKKLDGGKNYCAADRPDFNKCK
jgi:hypothetical protein